MESELKVSFGYNRENVSKLTLEAVFRLGELTEVDGSSVLSRRAKC